MLRSNKKAVQRLFYTSSNPTQNTYEERANNNIYDGEDDVDVDDGIHRGDMTGGRRVLKRNEDKKQKKPVVDIEEEDDQEDGQEDGQEDQDNNSVSSLSSSEDEYMFPNNVSSYRNDQSVVGYNIIDNFSYPFIDSIYYDLSELEDNNDTLQDMTFECCIYRVNTLGKNPFIEYLLYFDTPSKNKSSECIFPFFTYKPSRKSLEEQGDAVVKKLFDTKYIYRGYTVDESTRRCVLYYEKYFNRQVLIDYVSFTQKNGQWVWVSASEIADVQSYLSVPIAEHVVELFYTYPSIMFLMKNGQHIEIPRILYYGNHSSYISYVSAFGMKRQSVYSSLGPYFYFTDYASSMKYACYSYSGKAVGRIDNREITNTSHGRFNKGGLVRFAVFLGKTKTFFIDGPRDTSEVTMLKMKENEIVGETRGLRDSDGNWTRHYDSGYTGKYVIRVGDEVDIRIPQWVIYDYFNHVPLSYYYIDTTGIPEKYDGEFTDYKIL